MSLKDKLKALKFDHTDTIDGYNTLCDEDVEAIINLVDKEVIGETDDILRRKTFAETQKEIKVRDNLRAEQRNKLRDGE